jgi:hypothetical protein
MPLSAVFMATLNTKMIIQQLFLCNIPLKFCIIISCKYSDPPNTGLSGFRMVIFWTLLKSGFQMVLAAILLNTIPKPDRTFLTASLDRFGMKKNIF